MLGSRTLGPQLSNWWAIALDSSLTWSTWIMCWKFAWNITGAMVVDSRLNLEQHCGLLAEFHQNSPWIHSCYMLLSFGDNSDDVTTTEHDCGAAIGRRLKISGVMAGMCWRKLNLIVFIRTKLRNHPCCQELIFRRLDARTCQQLETPMWKCSMPRADQKQKRCGNPGGQTQISYLALCTSAANFGSNQIFSRTWLVQFQAPKLLRFWFWFEKSFPSVWNCLRPLPVEKRRKHTWNHLVGATGTYRQFHGNWTLRKKQLTPITPSL